MHVLGLEEVGHVLWPGVGVLCSSISGTLNVVWGIQRTVVVVAVVVGVGVLGGANVVHLVGGSALHAAGLGLFAGELWRVSGRRR